MTNEYWKGWKSKYIPNMHSDYSSNINDWHKLFCKGMAPFPVLKDFKRFYWQNGQGWEGGSRGDMSIHMANSCYCPAEVNATW